MAFFSVSALIGLETLTFDLLTSTRGHESPVSRASLLPIFSLLCSYILELWSGTGQTDIQQSSLYCALASCGVVYCNRSCLWPGLWVCLWVCYHDNIKIACIDPHQTGSVGRGSDHFQLNFGPPVPLGRVSAAGQNFLAPPYYSQHAVFASL